MNDQKSLVSKAFLTFASEAPGHAQAWRELTQNLAKASALDGKTASLAYLSVLASQRITSGIPFHVRSAKQIGASREEVISAILVGLPLAGNVVTQALPAALEAYDAD
jgi:alkylhydroperoxidase/carboxymuconolactone decarboxylase family protein YurZ